MENDKQDPHETDLIYNVFSPIKELGRGGQARVLKVRADRDNEGFPVFLASAIAWHEVNKHKQIAPLRQKIATINRNINTLQKNEALLMDKGDEEQAAKTRGNIETLQNALLKEIDKIKERQSQYVIQRSSNISELNVDSMIQHMNKIGLPYPEDDIFAMKTVLLDDDETLKTRFRDEFKSLKLLAHPNILQVYAEGEGYYIEEYIHGILDQKEIVTNSDETLFFSNLDRISIVIEAAKALEHTHLYGVIHRDIKPDNIAVDKDKNVRLIDFGLAKSAETEGLTQTGTAIGTPSYMCLEQIQNTKDANPTFDIYGLGATLYTYVTGEMPYKRARNKYTGEEKVPQSAQDIFLTVANKSYIPIPPSELAEGVPWVLEQIILKAMAKEQDLRYQSIEEFREDLEKYIEIADNDSMVSGSFSGIRAVQVDMKIRQRGKRLARSRDDAKKSSVSPAKITAVTIPVLVLFLVLALTIFKGEEHPSPSQENSGKQEQAQNIEEMFQYAVDFEKKNPEDLLEAIRHFEAVRNNANGTVFELKAQDRINSLRDQYKQAIADVLNNLEAKAEKLLSSNQYDEALQLYQEYDGAYSAQTEKERQKHAQKIRIAKSAYLQRLARAEKEQQEKAAQKQREQERLKRKAERKEREQIAVLKNKVLPSLMQRTADQLKAEEFDSAVSELQKASADTANLPIKDKIDSLLKTAETFRDFHRNIERHFQERIGKKITLEKLDQSSETGILKKEEDGILYLVKKMTVDYAALETVVKINIREISVIDLIKLARIQISDQDVLLAVFHEAKLRDETNVVEKLRSKAETHFLFSFLYKEPANEETPPEEEKGTVATGPVQFGKAFSLLPGGSLMIGDVRISLVHTGMGGKQISQLNPKAIAPDSDFPLSYSDKWICEGGLPVEEGTFNFKEEFVLKNENSARHTIELTHKQGLPTKWLFLACSIPLKTGTGKKATINNTDITLKEKMVLPPALRSGVKTLSIPVKGGRLIINNLPGSIYMYSAYYGYMFQLFINREGMKDNVLKAGINLDLEFIPDQPNGPAEDDAGWTDLLKGDSFKTAGWVSAGNVHAELSNGVLTKPVQDGEGTLRRVIKQPNENLEFQIDFEFMTKTAERTWIHFNLWPYEHWKGNGFFNAPFSGIKSGRHTIRMLVKGRNGTALLDGKVFPGLRNTLKRPLSTWCELTIGAPADCALKITTLRYRPIAEEDNNTEEDQTGWTDLLKGRTMAEAGWVASPGKDRVSLNKGVLEINPSKESAVVLKTVNFTSDTEFEFDFEFTPGIPDKEKWFIAAFWPADHFKGGGTADVQFIGGVKSKHHMKVHIKGQNIEAFLDGKPYRGRMQSNLKKPVTGSCALRFSIPPTAGLKLTNLRYRMIQAGQ